VRLAGGALTTLHVASYELERYRPRVVRLAQAEPLVRWCRREGVRDAIVGGFFLRASGDVLGELWQEGVAQPHVPFDSPWHAVRSCLQTSAGEVRIARRDELPPGGDLLQAGPLLVREGTVCYRDGDDTEGFSAGSHQFDSDITDGRHPRAALGLAESRLLAVVCDGRRRVDAGMTLGELAGTMAALGARDALNLDGGGSASLVYDRSLRNRPREQHGVDLLAGRPVVSAVVFAPR
jgi:hypothetical protein